MSPTREGIPIVAAGDFGSDVLAAEVPVLVDFFATWCGPCEWLTPYLEQAAERGGDRVRVVKVDVDEAPELSIRYGIRSVPTVILFRGGVEVERSIGVEPHRIRAMVPEGD